MTSSVFEPFRVLRSRTVVLDEDDIDTDQILPARFMATTSREGLGKVLFHDRRHDGNGPTSDVFNRIDPAVHRILVAGRNFGAGSSREHAPWALVDFGIRAVVAPSIADIFRGNAVQNGLLPLTVPVDVHERLCAADGGETVIDLPGNRLACPAAGIDHEFHLEPFARECLLSGRDTLGWLLERTPTIEAFERAGGSIWHT